jgi:hypothetical protein
MKSNVLMPSLMAFFGLLLCTASDCYTLDEEVDCTQKRKLITGSTDFKVNQSTIWSFSTADQNGGIKDADKNCHANMLLEFRFISDSLARLNKTPPVNYTFNGGGGTFASSAISLSSGIDQEGCITWRAECSQAAKNAAENPTSFGIIVEWDINQILELEDVWLHATIDYRGFY